MLERMQRFSQFMQQKMTLFIFADIVLALVVGSFYPSLSDVLKPYLPAAMFVMLYPMMIGIAVRELKQVGKEKSTLLLANIMNFLLSPLIAFLWAILAFQGYDPHFIAGWILKLTVPPAGMVLVWTGLSRGRVESALLIQVVGYLIAIAAVPLWMYLLAGTFVDIDLMLISKYVFLIIFLPLTLGIITRMGLIRKLGQNHFQKEVSPFLPPFSSIGMYVVLFTAISGEAPTIIQNLGLIASLGGSVLIIYPLMFMVSLSIASWFDIDYPRAIAIAFSSTAKNHGLTLAIAVSAFGGLAILPPSFLPLFQVLLMLSLWKLSPRIQRVYERRVPSRQITGNAMHSKGG
ncbi:MAG: bile acid:sodium symporter [Desulfohalobiaceae bacterium]|nr:bile acid:sodium symporter [Desulfohalobiaceae bacterium]